MNSYPIDQPKAPAPAQGKLSDGAPQPVPGVASLPMDCPEVRGMAQASVINYLDVALKAAKMESTSENIDKVLTQLTYKVHQWLVSGDIAVSEITTDQAAKVFFEQTCMRLGLPNTSSSWKKIIERL